MSRVLAFAMGFVVATLATTALHVVCALVEPLRAEYRRQVEACRGDYRHLEQLRRERQPGRRPECKP